MLIPCCQRVGQFVNKWFTGIGRFPTGHPIRSIEQVTDYEIVIFRSGSTKKKFTRNEGCGNVVVNFSSFRIKTCTCLAS